MTCLVEPSSSSASPLHILPPPSCDSQLILRNICQILQETLKENDSLKSDLLTSFDAVSTPSISLHDFLQRILKFSYCSIETLIIAVLYIERIARTRPEFLVNSRKIHRLVFVAIVISIKFLDDKYYNNEYYAKVGGVSLKEMNRMENDFLSFIEFRLFVEDEEFKRVEEMVRRTKENTQRKHHSRKD